MKKNKAYLFDVDGTLTPSRGEMDDDFQSFFIKFCDKHNVYLVTGSDKPKTVEQIGSFLYNKCRRVYNCSGNDVWEGTENTYTSKWKLDDIPWDFLEDKLKESRFDEKSGNHFDERHGMLNFSIVGRKCTQEQRQKYVKWDTENNERETIAKEFNQLFGKEYKIKATVAGETGLDITQSHCGKSQILPDFVQYDEIVFFGDKTKKGGNDYDISQSLIQKGQVVIPVKNWKETFEILKQ